MDIPYNLFGTTKLTSQYAKKHFPEFYHFLQKQYPDLIFSEQLYWFYHKLKDFPRCPICGKPTTYINFREGYHEYCCLKCAAKDNVVKIKKTCLERYGTDNIMRLDEFKEKSKQTCLERYGSEYVFNTGEFREKTKQTCLEKYGVDHPAHSEEIRERRRKTYAERYIDNPEGSKYLKERRKKTCLERYGDENYNNREKTKQTCLERYGEENPFQVEEFKEKSKKTMLERYGGEYSLTSPVIKEKITQIYIDKYGVDHQSKIPEVREKLKKLNRDRVVKTHDFILEYGNDGCWTCKCPHPECTQCVEKTYKIDSTNYFSRREFNIEPCTILKPIAGIPNKETTLELFVRKLLDDRGISYETNRRNIIEGRELDIYIPSKNIAIECNGTFFHSDRMKDKKYHMDKFNKCNEKGIQLLTIWEDQIFNIPEIVKSVILSKLGLFDKIIGARLCTICELTPKECAKFLNENHIQGETKTNIRLGLKYDGEIYGVMTFSKKSKLSGSKKIEEGEWELTRFCNKLNTSISGGFARLLNHFIKTYKPKTISSFASNDISNGNIYEVNGFKKDKVTESYWYIKKQGYIRYHRSAFTKSKLKNMGYDVEGKTESQIMEDLPYYKIYDCGHTKYILNL